MQAGRRTVAVYLRVLVLLLDELDAVVRVVALGSGHPAGGLLEGL
jgi:hypothetical protein